ncbi:MAG: hypothetical protein ACLGJD_11040 [Gammaproteobacteria bacterium]|uniref:hypothetical protein n=1 Tax=uncultured Pseudacidovorax sp. TaxID=679313 RepID=UPI0025ECC600|nr:hypothetical protein [uncultured Pseudacidovorax sp.]
MTKKANENVVPIHGSGGSDADVRAQARMLAMLGSDTISFNRAYVEITGNVLAALWLSYVIEQKAEFVRSGRAHTDGYDFTFAMTGQECEAATGISRAQQATCRRALQEAGLISEIGTRGRTVTYTLHLAQLRRRLDEVAAPLLAALQAARDVTPQAAAKRRAR